MQPTHTKKSFTANREFTDREEATGLFRKAFNGHQARDAYKVLNWYGVGGEGKSALSRKLIEIADEISEEVGESEMVARSRVNFEDHRLRRIDETLLAIRLQLARTFGPEFPCFDTAFARYFMMTNPGTDIRSRHPELFKGENELLEDLFDYSQGAVEVTLNAASELLPGAGLLYRYYKKLSSRLREWYQRRGKELLVDMDDMTPDELLEKLPVYLGADICDYLASNEKARVLIVLDTYEALWREYNIKDAVQGARADAWIRLLVQDTPGVLFAILGRDKLRWSEIDRDWQSVVETHRLGALSDNDADAFLRKVPIHSDDIRETIVNSSQGLPFYLDLQVDLFEKLADNGEPDPEEFGDTQSEILRRFLDHLTEAELATVRLASYPLTLSEVVMNELVETFLGGVALINWGWLTRQSFISTDEKGSMLMHALMKSALQEMDKTERNLTFIQVHQKLFDKYDELAKVVLPSEITQAEEGAFKHAVHHCQHVRSVNFFSWFTKRISFFIHAARNLFLERLFQEQIARFSLMLEPDDANLLNLRFKLAETVMALGRYKEATEAFNEIFHIQRNSRELGEQHPSTLSTREKLANLLVSQGRYLEAEIELRAVYEIQRQPDVLGESHPDVLSTRGNIATLLEEQGRYQEAQEVLQAVLEIQRHPDVLGEWNAATLATRNNLANILGRQGRYKHAETELRAVYEICRQPDVFGERHPYTLSTRNNLAFMLKEQGRDVEAEAEYRDVYDIRRKPDVLGENHPDTLTTRNNIAVILMEQGRYDEAENEHRAVYEIRKQSDVLGELHPETLTSLNNIAVILMHQDRYKEAEECLRDVYQHWQAPELLGGRHPVALIILSNLAASLRFQGRFQEAVAEYLNVYEIRRQPDLLGAHHPDTLTTRINLAETLSDQGSYREAEAEYRAVYDIRRKSDVLGERHPDTLATRSNLAKVLSYQGQYSEAEKEFRGVFVTQRSSDVLGEDDIENYYTQFWIAKMMDGQGQHANATYLLNGLEDKLLRHIPETHSWVTELREYLVSRGE